MKKLWYLLAAVAVVSLAASCHKHEKISRQNGGGNGGSGEVVNPGNQQTVFQLSENTSWTIGYAGRANRGGSTVDVIETSVPQNIIYLVSVINRENYSTYGGDLKSFMENERDWVMDLDADEQSFYIYSGPQSIAFDPFRHGTWYAFIMALDSDYKLTGEYAYKIFEVEEEEATDDFKKWLGSWTVKGKTDGKPARDVTYNLTVSSEEANYMYYVEGWEVFDGADEQMNQEGLVTYYDRGDMYFVSQYIQSYEENGDTMEECFLGEIDYYGILHEQGIYLIENEGIDLAVAQMDKDGKVSFQPCEVTTYIEDEEFTANFYDMKYFVWSQNDALWYHFNDNVAVFPLTMEKAAQQAPPPSGIARRGIAKPEKALRGKVYVPREQRKAKAVRVR